MDIFSAMQIISSGLGAERVRMNVTASNLANADTTRTEAGGPYKRRDPVFVATPLDPERAFDNDLLEALRIVEVTQIVEDQAEPRKVYDPGHPDAAKDGYVEKPNINLVEEMVNMITASRAYESGVTTMRSLVDMAKKSMSIGQ